MSSRERRNSEEHTLGSFLFSNDSSTASARKESDSEIDQGQSATKKVSCISCQRQGRKSRASFYCQDCRIGMCVQCTEDHREIRLNRHSISAISKTYAISPNQGPFPELTVIGTVKMDEELYLRGSTFLPNGELVTADFHNARIRVYSADYTRKLIAKFLIPKDPHWELKRPNPSDLTAISNELFAFTASNGCIYILKMGNTRIIAIERVISVINFDNNFGECLGLAYNDAAEELYVGCSADREGVFIKVYDLQGVPIRIVRDGIVEAPEYMVFGGNKSKLYTSDSDSVTVYDTENFQRVETYPELKDQIKDIFVDKYGYTYCLALERRTYNSAGSIYRLDTNSGVTKVTEMDERPASISYSPRTDVVAVTFVKSRYIFLYKLTLRSYQKHIDSKLRPHKKSK